MSRPPRLGIEPGPDYDREYHKLYYPGRRARRVAWLDSLRAGPCSDCGGVFPPECMDWDHVRGKKLFNVSMGGYGRSEGTILAEIAKCDLVCSNCHRIRTKKRGGTTVVR